MLPKLTCLFSARPVSTVRRFVPSCLISRPSSASNSRVCRQLVYSTTGHLHYGWPSICGQSSLQRRTTLFFKIVPPSGGPRLGLGSVREQEIKNKIKKMAIRRSDSACTENLCEAGIFFYDENRLESQ